MKLIALLACLLITQFSLEAFVNLDSSINKNCKIDSDCVLIDISCNTCSYYAKWVTANKSYKHSCQVKVKNEDCPEVLKLPSARPVCRQGKCLLKSPQELFFENKTFVEKLENHPLKNIDLAMCPKRVGRFYLSLPLSSNGIEKEKFFFKNQLQKEGMSSALKCYYRIDKLKESYVIATLSFQTIGITPIKSHFCERKPFESPRVFIDVDKDYAMTTSLRSYLLSGEKRLDTNILKSAFRKLADSLKKKYAISCNNSKK